MCERNQNKERSVGPSVPPSLRVEQLKKKRTEGEGDHKRQPKLFLGEKEEKKRSLPPSRRPLLICSERSGRRARPPHSAPLITACLMRAQEGRTGGRTDGEGRETDSDRSKPKRTGTKKWKNVLRWRPPLPSIPFLPNVGQGNRPRPSGGGGQPPVPPR